jgi:hypothetical protein
MDKVKLSEIRLALDEMADWLKAMGEVVAELPADQEVEMPEAYEKIAKNMEVSPVCPNPKWNLTCGPPGASKSTAPNRNVEDTMAKVTMGEIKLALIEMEGWARSIREVLDGLPDQDIPVDPTADYPTKIAKESITPGCPTWYVGCEDDLRD